MPRLAAPLKTVVKQYPAKRPRERAIEGSLLPPSCDAVSDTILPLLEENKNNVVIFHVGTLFWRRD